MTSKDQNQEPDEGYLREMGEYFARLPIDELAIILSDETSQADLINAAKYTPGLMDRTLEACELLPHGITQEQESRFQSQGELAAEKMFAQRQKAGSNIYPRAAQESVLSAFSAIITSLQPLSPAWQGNLRDVRAVTEENGIVIQGGEIVLTDYFEESILAENVPWAGSILRIVSRSDSRSILWVASVLRLPGASKQGTLRIELKDAEGQRSEVSLTAEYPTSRFPDRLVPNWVACISIE
jgi:hypothetical protein